MQDLMTMITTLHRPRLLARAAKFGALDYNRDRHLQRILGYGALPGTGAALIRLMEMEKEVNELRQEEDAGYSLVRHLVLLIALLGEAQLYQASRASHLN
ncbi:DUF6477 family protein [Ruegeria sp. EL01]|jgi:hypothetical protein|uniref:DUF6477 family protein n=1 Tax=Ruegeria sp. EL01 TaxID=2107578 RepID=UPI000EA826FC|nr:DUF6477 family protein [Ruegeria sp. EL01]